MPAPFTVESLDTMKGMRVRMTTAKPRPHDVGEIKSAYVCPAGEMVMIATAERTDDTDLPLTYIFPVDKILTVEPVLPDVPAREFPKEN